MTIELTIHRLSHEGRGVTDQQGKVTFVDNALPGEVVKFVRTQRHNRFDEGYAAEILQASPLRVTPKCQHFGICGGCSLQHLAHQEQIRFKQAQLAEQLNHFGGTQPKEWLLPIQAEPYAYRRKARLGVKWVAKKNKVLVGFREKNGRFLADLLRCEILHPHLGSLIMPFSELIASLSIKDQIPQLELAMGDKDAAVIVRHLQEFSEQDLTKLIRFGEEHQLWIFLQPKGLSSIHRLYPCEGSDYLSYHLPDFDVRFEFHASDFTQVNLEINRLMINKAIELLTLTEQDHVLDLFCGIGNFSLPISRQVASVLGVEGSAEMVQRAQNNATLNHINNVRYIAADLASEFSFAHGLKINKVLLDPPRAGAKEVLPHIIKLKPEKIVYVSCNPSTLARDAAELIAAGYRLNCAGVMDMFPHTAHVESIAEFVR